MNSKEYFYDNDEIQSNTTAEKSTVEKSKCSKAQREVICNVQ